MKISYGLAILVLLTAASAIGQEMAPDATAEGTHDFSTAEYRFPAQIHPEILSDRQTEIWARAFWPKDLIAGSVHPLLIFLHGNHDTCGHGTNPRIDDNSQYTTTGTCPDGYVVTPNHNGYNYLAQHFAKLGYIVVSINANRGITSGDAVNSDDGLNVARGSLILSHLALLYQWASVGGAPESLGLGADGLKGAIDFSQVGLMGHSRGGEGVRAAYNLYSDGSKQNAWPAKIPGLKIRGIYEIGAVDSQTSYIWNAIGVAWNQTIPMCDGDVSDFEGRRPFERAMKNTSDVKNDQKSIVYVWGANHNYFNTEWQTSDNGSATEAPICPNQTPIFDPKQIGSEKQQDVAFALTSAFFLSHVGKNLQPAFNRSFNPIYNVPVGLSAITRIEREFAVSAGSGAEERFEEFTGPVGKNSHGPVNDQVGIDLDYRTLVDDGPSVGMIGWDAPSSQSYFQTNRTQSGSGIDFSGYKTLDFRIGADLSQPDPVGQIDFSIELVSADGTVSQPVLLSDFARLTAQVSPNQTTQSARIPLEFFTGFDLSSIRGVRFVFDVSQPGIAPSARIVVAQIRFSRFIGFGDDIF